MRTDIQFLRGLAVLLVVLYHAGLPHLEAGYLGVDVFFVISGFLITGVILQALERGSFSFRGFYLRRAMRLLPAAYATLIFTTSVASLVLTQSLWADFFEQLLGSLTFTANFALMFQSGYFEQASESKPLLHMWSLSLEEQFYLLVPAVLVLLSRRSRPLALAVLAAISLFVCFYLVSGAPFGLFGFDLSTKAMQKLAFFMLPTRMWELLLGATGAWIMIRRPNLAVPITVKRIALLVVIFVCFFPFDPVHPRLDALTVALATIAMLLGQDNWLPQIGSTHAVARVGDWSYSLYLVHWPLFAFAYAAYLGKIPPLARLFLVLTALFLAYVQYRFVEERFRYGRGRVQTASPRSLTLGAALVVAVAVPSYLSSAFPEPSRSPDFGKLYEQNVGLSKDCSIGRGQRKTPYSCRNSDSPAVAVMGDSYAMHLIPGLLAADSELLGLAQFTKSACAPALGLAHVSHDYSPTWAADCIAFNDSAIKRIEELKSIKLVILSSPFYQVFSSQGQKLFFDGKPRDFDLTASIDHVSMLVEKVLEMGRVPLIVGPTPTDGADVASCWERYAESKLVVGRKNCNISMSDHLVISKPVTDALQQVQKRTGVKVVMPSEVLCRDDQCTTRIDDTYLYRDRGHFSVAGSAVVVRAMGLLENFPH